MQSNRTRITYFYQHFLVKMNTLTSVDSGNLSAFEQAKNSNKVFYLDEEKKGGNRHSLHIQESLEVKGITMDPSKAYVRPKNEIKERARFFSVKTKVATF